MCFGRWHKVLVILEGRDADRKDEMIKRIAGHLGPRQTRVVKAIEPREPFLVFSTLHVDLPVVSDSPRSINADGSGQQFAAEFFDPVHVI